LLSPARRPYDDHGGIGVVLGVIQHGLGVVGGVVDVRLVQAAGLLGAAVLVF